MFVVTKAASARLASKLTKKNAGQDVALRLIPSTKPGGWTLQLGCAGPSDITYLHDGRIVLILDESSSHRVRNKTLDVRDTEGGPKLRLRAC